MTALAFLRVDVSGNRTSIATAALGPLVQKFTTAYLEMRWAFPRQFVPLSETSFLLSDSSAGQLDPLEIRALSDHLQTHLFGAEDQGEVVLTVFEGSPQAVTAFAAMSPEAVAAGVVDETLLPPGGRLARVTSAPPATEPAEEPSPGAHWVFDSAPPPPPAWEGSQGIYFIPREVFFGDVVMYQPLNARTHLGLLDGPEHLPKDSCTFDAECLGIALRLLGQRRKGALLYLPISFTSLVRPSLRNAYEALLADLPPGRRSELAAAVYDVPRDPTFMGLREAKAMLGPHFSAIDLRTSDPEFEIEKLPAESVTSVTLMLPDAEPLVRLSALRRFADRVSLYKQRRIWPAVTNVRRVAELEMAARLRIPFVTGPAICGPTASPVGGRSASLRQLPMASQMRAPLALAS